MQLLHDLRSIMWPEVSPDVMRNMDSESLQGVSYATYAVSIAVAACLAFFLVTHQQLDDATILTAISMAVCCLLCFMGRMASRIMIRLNMTQHKYVATFVVILFVALSTWSVVVSYYRYVMGTQMLTFFMVDMMAMSFIVCVPWLSVILMGGAYGLLYAAIYTYDKAQHVNGFNYVVLMILTMLGMIVRFHVELRASERAVQLEYVGRHDELTGLLNRKALDEDMHNLLGTCLTVHLIDLNYFKEINDTYGHLTGDHVLRETARFLQELYPAGQVYRFGGDEFLVLERQASETAAGDFYVLNINFEGMSFEASLSIGSTQGKANTESDFNGLILEADKVMYGVKARTHT